MALVLAAVLVLPVMSVSVAYAADTPFSGGPQVGYAPTVVPNDHTPMAVRFSGSGLEPNSTYYVKVRLTRDPNPATGGGGAAHRGFIWNNVTGEWVRNQGEAWTEYPTMQTDPSGNVIGTNDANWLFFKFGNEVSTVSDTNLGTYYLNITLNKDGIDGQSKNSDTPLAVQVVDMKTQGAWLHNGTAAPPNAFKRVTLNSFDATSSTDQVMSISRTETNTIDDDSNLIVDDEDYGPVGKTGDWRLAASAETTVDVYIQSGLQSGVGGNNFVMGHADQDIALGAADQSAPTSPTALTATSADGKVTLDWDAATDDNGVASYKIYRWIDANSVEYTAPHVCIDTTTATTYEDTSVTGGVTYSYEVRAVDASTNVSARSDTAGVLGGATDSHGDRGCEPDQPERSQQLVCRDGPRHHPDHCGDRQVRVGRSRRPLHDLRGPGRLLPKASTRSTTTPRTPTGRRALWLMPPSRSTRSSRLRLSVRPTSRPTSRPLGRSPST